MTIPEIPNLVERAQLNPDAVRAFGFLGLSLILLTAGLGFGGNLMTMKEVHPILPTLGWGIKYTGEIGFVATGIAASWYALFASYNPTTGRTK